MPTTVEIFKQGTCAAERIILETTSTSEPVKPTKSDSYRRVEAKTQTEEFISMDDLIRKNRAYRFWGGASLPLGIAASAATLYKIGEQLSYTTGSYTGNPLVDAGVDFAAVAGSILILHEGDKIWRQANRVSAKVRELTTQGLAATLPTRN